MLSPQLAYSGVDADRVSSFQVSQDPYGNLGVDSKNDIGTIRGDSGEVKVGVLGNNLSGTMTIEGIFVSDINGTTNDGVLAIGSPSNFTDVLSGGTTDVTVTCGDSVNLGQRTVTVTVSKVTTSSVTISGVSFTFGADIQCKKGGGGGTSTAGFVAGDAYQNETQQFSFDVGALGNNDQATIDLSDAQGNGIDYSTVNSVTVVTGKGTATYDAATDQLTYNPSGNEKGTVTIEIGGFTINGDSGDRFVADYSDTAGRNDSDDYQIE